LGIDATAYHGGDLAGNAIRRLMEHAENVAMGVKQKLAACNIPGRDTEIEDLTSNIRVVLTLLDGIYSLLMTKYGEVTETILDDLAELLDLLREQWVRMQLPMTPKFHCLLRHAVSQLRDTGGGLCDLGEDGIERNHQERMKDNRRMTGIQNFECRTNSQTKMQFIRQMDDIKTIQFSVAANAKRKLKRTTTLKAEREEERKTERDAQRAEGSAIARETDNVGPQPTAKERNLREVASGSKSITRAKS
jgi:hypothetical protein